MQVYDQVREKNQYQSFTEKLREIRGTPYYLRVSSTREALKRSLQDLAKLNATVMAEHPVRLVEEFEPNQILQTAANAGGSALNIDAIELSIVGSSSCSKDDLAMLIPTESRAKWDAKYRLLKLCREAFQDASLRRAVMTGVADIARKLPSCLRYEMNSSGHLITIDECPPGVKPSPPKPDPNCCSLALDDPDLRLLRNIDAVVVKLDAGARAAFPGGGDPHALQATISSQLYRLRTATEALLVSRLETAATATENGASLRLLRAPRKARLEQSERKSILAAARAHLDALAGKPTQRWRRSAPKQTARHRALRHRAAGVSRKEGSLPWHRRTFKRRATCRVSFASSGRGRACSFRR